MEILIGIVIVLTLIWALFWTIDSGLMKGALPILLCVSSCLALAGYLTLVPVQEWDSVTIVTDRLSIHGQNGNDTHIVVFPSPQSIRVSTLKRWGSISSSIIYTVLEPR